MAAPDEGAAKLAALLHVSRRAVVFTGAGISTESGIPDFRSPGDIWTKMMPIDFGQFVASREVRRESWRRRFEMEKDWMAAKPNAGHNAVAELVRLGKVTHVITQNIDNLHQDSGVLAGKVIELHGNTRYAKCLSCNTRYEIPDIREHFEKHRDAPDCRFCGGIVKTATISFGQTMPEDEMERAQRATLACDLMLVIGSSLVVYPAAGFPLLAKRNGARYAILNREVTEHEPYADLTLHGEIGATMTAVLAQL